MAEMFSDLAAELVAELDHEFETNLIDAVKCHRCLYATDHKDYENMQQNKIAWLKISSSLNKSVPECMNKWYALLQTFLHHFKLESNNVTTSAPTIVWSHYKSIKEMQPYLAENYSELIQMKPPFLYGKPSATQKETLFAELETNRVQLVSTSTAMELRQQIWSQIVEKLNAIKPGARLPVIKWQKYWWDLKQNVGVQRSWIQTKLKAMGTQIEMSKYSDEDVRILKFCGATPADTTSCINSHLSSNLEFGCNTDQIIRKCKKCTIVLNDLLTNDYCDTCRKIPKTLCDICSTRHEEHLNVYKLKNWSTHAKNLLPSSFFTYAELSMCKVCSNNLKKQASLAWRACRVCESYNQVLENIFAPSNDNIRKAFKDVTNYHFVEGDGLPVYICKICKIQMQQFNNFYLRFWRAQNRFLKIHLEKLVGVPTARLPGKKKANCSVTSANQIMILKPEAANSNAATEGIQQNYTELTKALLAPPTPLPPPSEHTYSKRIRPTQAENKKIVRIPPGSIIAKQICSFVPAKTRKVKFRIQPSASPVPKGLCTLRPGTAPETPINANATPPVTKGICSVTVTPVLNTKSKVTQGIKTKKPGSVPVTTTIGTTITKQTLTKTTSIATKGAGVLSLGTSSIPITTETAKKNSLFPPEPTALTAVIKKENSAPPPGSVPIPSITVKLSNNVSKQIHSPHPAESAPIASIIAKPPKSVSNHIQTPQPTVFTISGVDFDYEEQLDSPPIFCIPKSTSALENANNKLSKIVKPSITTSSTEPTPTHPTIKTEKIDDGYPGEQLPGTPSLLESPHHGTNRKSEVSSNASIISVESPNLSSPSAPTTPKRMKLVRLDGSMVVFNPNPSPTNRTTPNAQNKNSAYQNEFLSTKFHVIQPRKAPKDRRKLQTGSHPTEELHQPGNKRARKYWGAVDEFQITPMSVKTNASNPQPIKERRKTIHNLSAWSGDIPVGDSSTTSRTPPALTAKPPPEELPTNAVIKVEKEDQLNSDLNPSMFYPDSFELGNFSLDDDLSSMLSSIVTDKVALDENMKNFESFLASYALDQDQSKQRDESKKDETNENDPGKGESKARQSRAEKHKENTSNIKIPIKKLRIMLKRNKMLKKLASRLKNKVPQSPPLITRKSLRQSNVSRSDKPIT